MGEIITRTLRNGRVAYLARYYDVDRSRKVRATKAKTPEEAQRWLDRAEARIRLGHCGDPREEARKKAAEEAGDRARKAAYEQAQRQAERLRKVAEEEAARRRLTLRQLCERFVGWTDDRSTRFRAKDAYEGDGLRDTIYYRRQAWSVLSRHVLPSDLEQRDIASLGRPDIVKLKDGLTSGGKSAFIVSRVLRQLGRVFNWAVERSMLAANPCSGVRKPKTVGATRFYTNAEVAQLLTWAAENDADLHTLIAFAYYTGCRKGEIAALRWADVDWQGARILIQGSWKHDARKSGVPVVVSMHPHLQAILVEHQRRTGGEGAQFVFPAPPPTELGRERMLRRGVDVANRMRDKFDNWGLDEAIAAKKVRRFRQPWHSFRHTHATTLAVTGAGLTAIRDALGQSTLQMAANYTHLAAEHVRAHVERLPTIGPVAPAVTSIGSARQRRSAAGNSAAAQQRADAERSERAGESNGIPAGSRKGGGPDGKGGAADSSTNSVSPVRFELTTNGLKER
jgi:integrase